MAVIITRAAKGSPLTNNEMDQNLINLNNDKIETSVLPTLAPKNSPIFTGNPTAPTPPLGDNDTSLATTAFVLANSVQKTSNTASAILPSGNDAQRDASPNPGYMRYNTQSVGWEGWNGSFWTSIGGGQMYGLAAVKAVFYNSQTINENLTIASGQNGGTFGPVTVNNGFTVTVSNGSVWTIV